MKAFLESRYLLIGASVVAMTVVSSQAQLPQMDSLDRAMGSIMLGTIPSQPPGDLVVDGDGVCDRFAYSACGYKAGAYEYYFFGGRLISKGFTFSDANPRGPWALTRSDTRQDVVRKLRFYVGRKDPAFVDNVLFYELECAPHLCRLDIQLANGAIESVRLFYGDAV